MATGDKVQSTKVRVDSNERLDKVDFDRVAAAAELQADAAQRALVSTPKATAAQVIGERWTGSITANPTSGSDNTVRVDSAPFVGVDSNGKLVLKPVGVTLSVTIPGGGGNYQVYLYTLDVDEDTQVRRFVNASTPYAEFQNAINVAKRQTAALYVRAGTLANTVPEDTVAGATRSLLLLGIATNTGGNVTFTPAANMLETVTQPTGLVTTSTGTTTGETTVTGPGSTLRDLLNIALYELGQAQWKGSDTFTPAAANNYGAYRETAGGVDKAFRNALGDVTIGSGVGGSVGDFNLTDFAGNAKQTLDAAIALLPAVGGRIWLKRGCTLTNFNTTSVTLPANKHVEIIGDHAGIPSNTPHIVFANASEFIACDAAGSLTLRNLHIRASGVAVLMTGGPVTVIDCFVEKPSGAFVDAPFKSTTTAQDLLFEGVTCSTTLTATANGYGFVACIGVVRRATFLRCRHVINGEHVCGSFFIGDMRENVKFADIDVNHPFDSVASGSGAASFVVASTDNVNEVRGREFRNITVRGALTAAAANPRLDAIIFDSIQYLRFINVRVEKTVSSVVALGTTFGYCEFESCDFGAPFTVAGGVLHWRFSRCIFRNGVTLGNFTDAVDNVAFAACRFYDVPCLIRPLSGSNISFDENCWFERFSATNQTSALEIVTPITPGSVLENILVRGTFRAIRSTATASVCCMKLTTFAFFTITVEDVTVEDFQNGNFAAADPATFPRLIEVNADQGEAIVIRNVRARDVMSSAVGLARRGAVLLDLNSADRTTDVTTYVGSVTIENVELGEFQGTDGHTSASYVALLRQLHVWVSNYKISNARVFTTLRTGGLDTQIGNIIHIATNGAALTHSMTITDCLFHFANPASVPGITVDILNFINAAAVYYVITFAANVVTGGFPFDFVSAQGIDSDSTVHNLTFKDNVHSNNAGAGNGLRTQLAATRTNPSGGVPATGIAWTNNLLCAGG